MVNNWQASELHKLPAFFLWLDQKPNSYLQMLYQQMQTTLRILLLSPSIIIKTEKLMFQQNIKEDKA